MENYIDKANSLIAEKKFEEAKTLLQSNLLPDSEDIEAVKLLGLCNVNLKCTNQAIEAFEIVVKKSPEDATSWFYLASMYDEVNNIEKAEQAYKKVISLREEYVLAYKNIAVMYIKHRMPDKAKSFAQKAISVSSKNPYSDFLQTIQDYEKVH